MELLQQVHEWVQKGYDISYIIVNQIENGNEQEIAEGRMPRFTYTFIIYECDEEKWHYSVDTLKDGFTMAIDWIVKENQKSHEK